MIFNFDEKQLQNLVGLIMAGGKSNSTGAEAMISAAELLVNINQQANNQPKPLDKSENAPIEIKEIDNGNS